jgi:hypothetical protein
VPAQPSGQAPAGVSRTPFFAANREAGARSATPRPFFAAVQPKLSIGQPDDRLEREADEVADRVVRGPEKTFAAPPPVRPRGEENALQAAPDGEDARSVTPAAQRAVSNRQGGSALQPATRSTLESRMGADLGAVRVHDDSSAQEAAHSINARAFANQNDIWLGAGESQDDLRLMAHEVTHVLQQSDGAPQVMRSNGAASSSGSSGGPNPPAGVTPIAPMPEGQYAFRKDGKDYKYIATDTSKKKLHLPEVRIPNFKQRHQGLHQLPLIRQPGPRDTDQRNKWRNHFNTAVLPPLHQKLNAAERRHGFKGDGDERVYYFKGTRNQRLMLFGTRRQLLVPAVFPFWDNRQQTRAFQVDHRREDQLGGEDKLDNYELLDARANASSGSRIAREINHQVGSAIAVYRSAFYRNQIGAGARRISGSPSYIKQNYELQFNRVRYNLRGVPDGDRYWSVRQITRGAHLGVFRPLTAREVDQLADSRRKMLFTSPTGGVPIRAPESVGERTEIWPRVVATGPLQIQNNESATLPVDAYRSGENPNGLQAAYPGLTFFFKPVPGIDAWAIDKSTSLQRARQAGAGGVFQSLRLPGLSPIQINELDLDPSQGFVGRGKLLPTVPLFADANIELVIKGGDIRLQKTFNFEEIAVPRPFEIYHSSLTVFAGTQGLGVEGLLGFGIDRVGEGELNAAISTEQGFSLAGRFAFDEQLFGKGTSAEVRIGYAQNQWSVGGTLTIPEGKVPGIRSATINVDYSEGAGLSATGAAQLDVPGIQEGTLKATYNDETGAFSVGGSFQLKDDIPGIRGGSVEAEVCKDPQKEGYQLTVKGEAQPDIPGFDTKLSIEYENGALTIAGKAAYARGMLSGEVNVGATNRAVGADGQPVGEPTDSFTVYGGGELTLTLTPWLKATAGVQFLPNGEMQVKGEIGLPSEVDVFDRIGIPESELFSLGFDIPIFAIPVGPKSIGLKATIRGGLKAYAGIGPGKLTDTHLGIEYNPAHEDQTHLYGSAKFVVPAEAGLKFFVRATIGLNAVIGGVEGGLEVSAGVGLDAEASAGVNLDWTPASGLELRATLAAHIQPKLTFDIDGVIEAWFAWYEKEWRWSLASYEYGPDMRFGIRLPIVYKEGEPFDISFDDIVFEKPQIDSSFLKGLIKDIKNSRS